MNLDRFRMTDDQAKELLALSSGKGSKVPRKLKGAFVRPCPVDWIRRAIRLPGKASAVALACWYAAGLAKSMTVQITPKIREDLKIYRECFRNGLEAMEEAGMVAIVDGRQGASPTITILFEDQTDAE